MMNGFLNDLAVPTNSQAINSFYRHVGFGRCGDGAKTTG
jgi:hypothetical protein